MMRYSRKPASAMPNAGLPSVVEGRNIYLCSPEYMAQYARRFMLAGVKIVGGCCGTTAEHIKEIRSEARSLQPGHRTACVTVEEPEIKAEDLAGIPMGGKAGLGHEHGSGRFLAFA